MLIKINGAWLQYIPLPNYIAFLYMYMYIHSTNFSNKAHEFVLLPSTSPRFHFALHLGSESFSSSAEANEYIGAHMIPPLRN